MLSDEHDIPYWTVHETITIYIWINQQLVAIRRVNTDSCIGVNKKSI